MIPSVSNAPWPGMPSSDPAGMVEGGTMRPILVQFLPSGEISAKSADVPR